MPERNMNPAQTPMPAQNPDVRVHNFDEVTLGYTKEMADQRGKALPAMQA